MKCYPALSVLEVALQGECSTCLREFKDEGVVYRHMWYYAELWENNPEDLPKETEWVRMVSTVINSIKSHCAAQKKFRSREPERAQEIEKKCYLKKKVKELL